MKVIVRILMLLIFATVVSCTDKNLGKTIHVKYNQPIRDYEVEIAYNISSKDYDTFRGIISFVSNRDTIRTEVISSFTLLGFETNQTITYDSLNSEQSFFIDYYLPEDYSFLNNNPSLEGFGNNNAFAPFYFFDVNFDRKEELIKFNGSYGERNRLLYSVYSFPEDTILSPCIEGLELSQSWFFDRRKQRIITDVTCGYCCNSSLIWEWDGSIDSLILSKEITELNCIDEEKKMKTCHTIYEKGKIIKVDTVTIDYSNLLDDDFLYRGLD